MSTNRRKTLGVRRFADLSRYLRIGRQIQLAGAHYRVSPFTILPIFLKLTLIDKFSPSEIFGYGLLSPSLTDEDRRRYLSKEKSLRLLRGLNPPAHACLVEDKILFYKYCGGLGLPIPKLFAVIERGRVLTPDGQPVAVPSEWEFLLRTSVRDDFVIKPAGGVYGRGLEIYSRVNDEYQDKSRDRHSARGVYAKTISNTDYDRFLLQERLRDHPDLRRLSQSKGVQTARFNTFLEEAGDVKLLFYMLKVISGDSLIDNFESGTTGNLIAVGEPDTGRLRYAYALDSSGFGLKRIDHHPVTGLPFSDFQIPFWKEARQLVLQAANHFLPLRAIGWDVAITPTGPRLLEGNVWWDPTNYAPELIPQSQWDVLARVSRETR